LPYYQLVIVSEQTLACTMHEHERAARVLVG
jgi:hypothetical protein